MLKNRRKHRIHSTDNVVDFKSLVIVCLLLSCLTLPVHAGIYCNGNVFPGPPPWDIWTSARIGYSAYGTMSITEGDTVSDLSAHIGVNPGSEGKVYVTGPFSTWKNSYELCIGVGGMGYLEIADGGKVSCRFGTVGGSLSNSMVRGAGEILVTGSNSMLTLDTFTLGMTSSASRLSIENNGEVIVEHEIEMGLQGSNEIFFNNGILTTGNLICASADLVGTGTINTNGLSSDVDLVFDDTHGLVQTLSITGIDKNITVNLDVDGSASIGIGYGGNGTMSISNGIVVESTYAYIGHAPNSESEVTVDGTGSTWVNSESLHVGHYHDNSVLNITNGGKVTVEKDTRVYPSGTTVFNNGTLITNCLFCDSANLSGSGTINTHGLVSNIDLVFDNMHGLIQTFSITDSSKKITFNLNVDGSAAMGVGYDGNSIMRISDGIVVESTVGYIGVESAYAFTCHTSNSIGKVTVDGNGSTWANSRTLYVGHSGNGTLNITGGGTVSNSTCHIGYASISTSEVTVDGDGSTWTNDENLCVGYYGCATLNITNYGLVSVAGTLTIDLDDDGDGFINMADGGKLALFGEVYTLDDFLGLIEGSAAIRYWDGSDWADIGGATYGVDYALTYMEEGDLAGYTVLTVPEPSALVILIAGLIGVLIVRRY